MSHGDTVTDDQKWFKDLTANVHYRVTTFKHPMGRIMEEWVSSSGESWYLNAGMSQSTFLSDHELRPCDPVPGLLSK
jgi:hypothetical protein